MDRQHQALLEFIHLGLDPLNVNDHFPIKLKIKVAEVREIISDVYPVNVQLELRLRFQIPNNPGLLHGLENFIMSGFFL